MSIHDVEAEFEKLHGAKNQTFDYDTNNHDGDTVEFTVDRGSVYDQDMFDDEDDENNTRDHQGEAEDAVSDFLYDAAKHFQKLGFDADIDSDSGDPQLIVSYGDNRPDSDD